MVPYVNVCGMKIYTASRQIYVVKLICINAYEQRIPIGAQLYVYIYIYFF